MSYQLGWGIVNASVVVRRIVICNLVRIPNPYVLNTFFLYRYHRFALSTRINICICNIINYIANLKSTGEKWPRKVAAAMTDWLTFVWLLKQARPRNWAGYQPIWVTANKCTWWSSRYNIIMWIYSRPMRYIMGNILFYYLPGEVLWSGGVWLVWYGTWW